MSIRASFPDDASSIDERMTREGFDPNDAPYIWIEHFSQCTTDALIERNAARAEAHLKLLSRLLDAGDERTAKCIDVAYVETLMRGVEDQAIKKEGWKLVPANLRRLYIAMWGQQPFMGKDA